MNWEVDNNNFGGLRIPGVFATPTQGGFQSFASPEDGLTAIAHQLDRYFSGKTTGKPLNTLNQIINTWAPPSDNNPTNALIQRASQIVGVSPDAPLDFSNPDTRAKLIEATVRNEQGGKLPVDPSIIQKVAASYTPGAAAPPSGNNKMLPGFGNARSASQLMPAASLPPSVEQTGGLPMADPAAAAAPAPAALAAAYGGGLPTNVAATGGLYSTSAAGESDPNDLTAMLPKLMAQAKSMGLVSNPSQMLANMSAGFFGGRGPAQSLAGGFGGLAKAQGQDQESGLSLLKMAMMYGPMFQEKIRQANQTAATNLAARGKIPLGQAFQQFGLPPVPGMTYEDMNDTTPLPAGSQKIVDGVIKDIGDKSNLQQRYTTAAQQLQNGEFHVDYGSRAKYAAILADPTGLAAKMAPETLQEALKYNAFDQLRSQAQQLVQNAQKGALSDFRSSEAGKAIMGGYGTVNDQAAAQHFTQLANATAMDINNDRNRVIGAYKSAGHKNVPKDLWSSQNLPETPLQQTPVGQIYNNPYQDNTRPSAAPVGNGAVKGALSPEDHALINKYLQP
jgi:hypothetical protein